MTKSAAFISIPLYAAILCSGSGARSAQLEVVAACPFAPPVPGGSLVITGSVRNATGITVTNVLLVVDRPVPNTLVRGPLSLASGQVVSFTNQFLIPPQYDQCLVELSYDALGRAVDGMPAAGMLALSCPIALLGPVRVSDFQDGTTQGWQSGAFHPQPPANAPNAGAGGAGNHALRVIANGGPREGRALVVFNASPDWTGDYLARGIQALAFHAANSGTQALELRVALVRLSSAYVTFESVLIPAGSDWERYVVPLDVGSMLVVGTQIPDDPLDILRAVEQARILHQPSLSYQGATIAAELLLDNVQLVGGGMTVVGGLSDRAIASGTEVVLSAQASAQPPVTFQWSKDGLPLPGATSSNLTLANLTLADSGDYCVEITGRCGIDSDCGILQVLDPPSINMAPGDTNVTAGSSVTFCVTAGGSDPFLYQWRLNGVNIPDATNSCLAIPSVQLTNGGNYTVVVANRVGAITTTPALLVVNVPILDGADSFAARTPLGTNRLVAATNSAATRESQELFHAGKFCSNSVWYSWTATANGIVEFKTDGSAFDTLLAAYQGLGVGSLTEISADDDGGSFHRSRIQFNVQSGETYAIVVDGFAGSHGRYVLGLQLETTAEVLPTIQQHPTKRTIALRPNEPTNVTFSVTASGTNLTYQWFFNGNIIIGATGSNFTRINLQVSHVGEYFVRVRSGAGRPVDSRTAVLQIGPDPNVQAVDKLGDLLPLNGGGGFAAQPALAGFTTLSSGGGAIQVRAGSIGSQISRLKGSADGSETSHCGIIGGVSQWLNLEAEEEGFFIVDTDKSEVNLVLAAYIGPYLALANIACSVNERGFAVMRFPAVPGVRYAIAADQLDPKQTGRVSLNWRFGFPPAFGPFQAQNIAAREGECAMFAPPIEGSPTPSTQWHLNGRPLPFATNNKLGLPFFIAKHSGVYQLTLSNLMGTALERIGQVTLHSNTFRLVTPVGGGGRIERSLEALTHPTGTVIRLQAFSEPGWTFLSWRGIHSQSNSIEVTIGSDLEVAAVFGTPLTIGAVGNGAVRVTPAAPLYPYGADLSLIALPDDGHHFQGWQNELTTDNPRHVSIRSAAPVYRAIFAPLPAQRIAVTAYPEGRGTILVEPPGHHVTTGQPVRFTAFPDQGQTFLGWTAPVIQTNPVLVLSATTSVVATALFSRDFQLEAIRCLPNRGVSRGMVFDAEPGASCQIDLSVDLSLWSESTSFTNWWNDGLFIPVLPRSQTPIFFHRVVDVGPPASATFR